LVLLILKFSRYLQLELFEKKDEATNNIQQNNNDNNVFYLESWPKFIESIKRKKLILQIVILIKIF
jgi:hypothetical protein